MRKLILTLVLATAALFPALVLGQPEVKSARYTITKVNQYNLQVVRIAGRGLIVDVEGYGRRRFQVPRDFTFDIDGDAKTLNQLVPGQRLRAYVTHTESGELMLVQNDQATEGFIGESVSEDPAETAEDSMPGSVVPPEEDQESLPQESSAHLSAELPETAGNTGWLAVLGILFTAVGVWVGPVRRYSGAWKAIRR